MKKAEFNLSLAKGTFSSSNSGEITKEELLRGIDDLKGSPDEQLRNKAIELVDSALAEIQGTIGFPGLVRHYDGIKISVSITDNKEEEDELKINLGDIPSSFSSPW